MREIKERADFVSFKLQIADKLFRQGELHDTETVLEQVLESANNIVAMTENKLKQIADELNATALNDDY
jgi:hypothetical protein